MSPQAHTSGVFETILNFSDYENRKIPWYKQMNLLDIMKIAGYKTFWFSNQEKISVWGNAPTAISTRANFAFWTHLSNGVSNNYDEELIPLYEKNKQHLGDKNFIIFHLQGSHIPYKNRFPKSYAKFKPSDIDTKKLHITHKSDLRIVADYVNSFYYTDAILNKIFNLFKNTDSIIFYFSDHAQDVFQSRNSVGHTCDNYGVEIPFMIFVTDEFKHNHPDKIKSIKSALKKPFMTDDFSQSLLPLIDIKTKDNIKNKDIFSPDFDTQRKRIYCGNIDYLKQ
ncbi:sulfatase [Helicobacter sp. 13S00477-4]|nr:sulfatase [Helicobacter sp. 13S00477-4]